MPKPKAKPKTSYKKKYYRRRRKVYRKNKSMLSMTSPVTGFPSKFHTKLKYGDTYTFTMTTGANSFQTFRANSLNDPDQTGTGHQPTYYDQIGAIYGSVRVSACKIKATFMNASDVNCIAVLKASNGIPTVPTNISDEIEDYMTTYTTIGHSDGIGKSQLRMYRTLKSVVGRKGDYDRYVQSSLSSDPTDVWYYTLMAQPLDESSSATVRAIVRITYYCTFYNRLGVTIS